MIVLWIYLAGVMVGFAATTAFDVWLTRAIDPKHVLQGGFMWPLSIPVMAGAVIGILLISPKEESDGST